MSEMIERVAIAIFAARQTALPLSRWNELTEAARENFTTQARAAIEAMREPTDDMIEAMRAEEEAGGGCWRETFTAAVDAALLYQPPQTDIAEPIPGVDDAHGGVR